MLEARGVKTTDRLHADVEGDIDDIDGVIRVTRIRVRFRLESPESSREVAERALERFADRCPAYVTVRESLDVTCSLELI